MSKKYFKKTLAGIFALAIVASATPLAPFAPLTDSISITASAEAAPESDFEFDSETGTITKYLGAGGDVEIPSAIGGVPVKSIGSVFYGCRSLTSIIIPEGVTSIDASAFESCMSLKSVTIPDTVTSIGKQAFRLCSALTSIDFPDSVTSIAIYAFQGCSSLKSINIPASVTNIEEQAFVACYSLSSINVDENNTAYFSVDDVLFNKNATTLILYPAKKTDTEYTIPNTVTSIAAYAFAHTPLTSITIPDSVTKIGSPDPFYETTSLTKITAPCSLKDKLKKHIDQCIFTHKYEKSVCVECGESIFEFDSETGTIIKYLGEGGDVEIPSAIYGVPVTSIDSSAFESCSSLTKITAPCSLKDQLSQYSDICKFTHKYKNGVCDECGENEFEFDSETGTITKYIGTGGDVEIPSTIGGVSVKTIGNGAFAYLSEVTSVTIPNTVTSIDKSAFYNCSALKSITIPNSVTSIAYMALSNTALTSVEIPDSVTSISSGVFQQCYSLKSVTLPESIDKIRTYTFYSCYALTSIEIPGSVTVIDDFAFDGTALKTVYYSGSSADWNKISIAQGNGKLTNADDVDIVYSIAIASFDMNGHGSAIDPVNVKINGKLELPKAPSETDYVFEGWYTDADCTEGNEFDTNESLTADITLYAKWTKLCTLTFDMQGHGTQIDAIADKKAGSAVAEPDDPSETGYAFDGWYTDEACTDGNEFDFDEPLTDDITIYAKWTKLCSASFNMNGHGKLIDAIFVYPATVFDRPNDPSETDYVFDGWYTDADCTEGNEFDFSKPLTDDITIYAKWTKLCTLTFDMQGHGTQIDAVADEKAGIVVAEPDEPSETGYVFEGWYTDEACTDGNEFDFSKPLTDDITIYAKWTKLCNAAFDMQGHGTQIDSLFVYPGETFDEPNDPSESGYKFAGWYTDADCTDGNEFDFSEPLTADITIYAKWTVTVTFDFGGIDAVAWAPIDVQVGKCLDCPTDEPVSIDYHYTFGGWYADPDCTDGNEFDFSKPVTGGTTIYAKWNKQYKVSFDTADTNVSIESVFVKEGNKLSEPTGWTSPSNYAFSGWYTDNTYSEPFDFTQEISEDTVVYGNWKMISGEFGEDLTWEYNEEKKELTVKGSGTAIADYPEDYPGFHGLPIESVIFDTPNLEVIGQYAFCDISDLKEVTIPETVKQIKQGAFASCVSLERITIPASVTSIGYKAFGDTGIKTAVFESDVLNEIAQFNPDNEKDIFGYSDCLKVIYVPAGCGNAYLSSEGYQAALGYFSDYITEMPAVKGYSVSYDGDVTINFHYSIPDSAKNGYIKFSDGTIVDVSSSTCKDGNYIIPISMAAKNMYDEITAQFYDENDDPVGEPVTFKMVDYLDAVKAFEPSYADFVDSFLEYGAQAAAYFGNTNAPASTKTYDYASIISGLKADGYDVLPNMGDNYVGATMLLKSTPILRLYYKEEVNGLDLGDNEKWDTNEMNQDLTFIQKEISATNFATTFNGYSVYHYLYKALEAGDDEKLMKLCAALYEFGKAADAISE